MKVLDSTLRILQNISLVIPPLNRRETFRFSRCLLRRCISSSSFVSSGADIVELRNSCVLPSWNTTLAEGRRILEEKYGFHQNVNNSGLSPAAESVIRRLQSSESNSTHLINTFKNLLHDYGGSTQWPGTVTLLLAKAVADSLSPRNFSAQHPGCDATWKSQMIVADVVNLLQGSILFRKECERLRSPTKTSNSQTDFTQLVSHYFISTALYKIGHLNNCKASWLISSILESLAKAGSQKHVSEINYDLLCNLDDWEYNSFHPQGILLANGCQAVLELTGHGKTVQQMALDFSRYLVLAIKAHSDIHHFMQYQKSEISYLKLNALPVTLHLENNPELLAYIYSCGVLDNLDHFLIYSAVNEGPSLTEANKILESYIHAAVQILKEFSCSPETKNLIKLTESLKNIQS